LLLPEDLASAAELIVTRSAAQPKRQLAERPWEQRQPAYRSGAEQDYLERHEWTFVTSRPLSAESERTLGKQENKWRGKIFLIQDPSSPKLLKSRALAHLEEQG
jgi:hypothetical protein